jgi:hypothetical protein
MSTRKADRKHRKNATRKQSGGKRALTPWNKHVKRVYEEMKRKDSYVQFKDALVAASKRKNEM